MYRTIIEVGDAAGADSALGGAVPQVEGVQEESRKTPLRTTTKAQTAGTMMIPRDLASDGAEAEEADEVAEEEEQVEVDDVAVAAADGFER